MGKRAIVLAAGLGKRMKSQRPKVLHEVLGKAIITRVLDALDDALVEHIHIVLGHGREQVEEYLQANPPRTKYSLHVQEPQLGTGHAVMQVADALNGFLGTLLVCAGDTPLLSSITLSRLIEEHEGQKASVSLLSTIVDDPKNYGRIVRDTTGRVTHIVEDKDANEAEKKIPEVNASIYCFSWPQASEGLSQLKNDNRQKEYYLTDLVGWAVAKKLPVSAVITSDWQEVCGINSRLELAEANELLNKKVLKKLALEDGVTILDPESSWIAPEVKVGQDTTILPCCFIMGDVTIGANCTIGPNAVIHGPTRIGNDTKVTQSLIVASEIGSRCQVGPFAHMRDNAEAGDSVRIGNFVEVKKSVIGNQTNVSHLSYIGDAEIGSGANIGAGTITANYDHITKRKERTIIGDNASTGSNSVLVAPVNVGSGAVVAAGTVVTKDVPNDSLAVGRARQEIKEGWSQSKRRQAEKKS